MTIRRLRHHDLCELVAEVVGVDWYIKDRLPQACLVCDYTEGLSEKAIAKWILIQEARTTFGELLNETVGDFHEVRSSAGYNSLLQPF